MNAWTFVDGGWRDGNPGIMGPMTLGAWLGSIVFDGARAFEGVAPDLDLHCARVVRSAEAMGMASPHRAEEILEIARDGIGRFPNDAELYIRPMMWAESGWIYPDPDSTRFCCAVYEAPLPPAAGFSAMLSPLRRPSLESAPTNAKAACLYPQAGRALRLANDQGFDNAIMLDPTGNVAELCTANVMLVKDGIVHTPIPNGTFLDGITRQRVIALLRAHGHTVVERSIRPDELDRADEIFSTGNYGKVMPVTRYHGRDLQPGPVFRAGRQLYWDFAHG